MPALYRKQLNFNFIGLFMIMLLGSTYLIDRVVIYLMRPQLTIWYRSVFSSHNNHISAMQISYLALFMEVYYVVVFICVALLLWLVLSVFKNCRLFLQEFRYAIICIFLVRILVVCTMRFVLKIIP